MNVLVLDPVQCDAVKEAGLLEMRCGGSELDTAAEDPTLTELEAIVDRIAIGLRLIRSANTATLVTGPNDLEILARYRDGLLELVADRGSDVADDERLIDALDRLFAVAGCESVPTS